MTTMISTGLQALLAELGGVAVCAAILYLYWNKMPWKHQKN